MQIRKMVCPFFSVSISCQALEIEVFVNVLTGFFTTNVWKYGLIVKNPVDLIQAGLVTILVKHPRSLVAHFYQTGLKFSCKLF